MYNVHVHVQCTMLYYMYIPCSAFKVMSTILRSNYCNYLPYMCVVKNKSISICTITCTCTCKYMYMYNFIQN